MPIHLAGRWLWITRAVLCYMLATGLVGATLLLHAALGLRVGDPPILILYMVPILLAAYAGGLGPGLLATVLAALLSDYFCLRPAPGLGIAQPLDRVEWFVLWGAGILVSLLSEGLRGARRRAEAAGAALRESEQRLRLLVEGAQDYALFMLDPQGRVASWNAGAERLEGWSDEEVLGQHFAVFYGAEARASGRPESDLAAAAVHGTHHREGQRLRKDGSPFWAEVLLTAVRDRSGELRGFAQLVRDISGRKQAEDAMQHARQEAEAANRAKDHFLAALSHELRTPLTPVLVTVSTLQERPGFDPATCEDLEMIRRNMELEAQLIDDLLDVTRIARGKIELRRQRVEMRTVLRHAVEVCQLDLEARELHFAMDIEQGPHLVYADPARLQQVFWNLLRNAIKFTPRGGCVGVRCYAEGPGAGGEGLGATGGVSAPSLTADPYPPTPTVVVEVADSGEGIDPALLPRIFQAFEQGGAGVTRQFGGLGLGLTITKGLVEAHGGSISARSEGKGKGATFTVKLPLVLQSAIASVPVDRSPGSRPSAGGAGARQLWTGDSGLRTVNQPLRILLVEDHDDTARIMNRLLKSHGHEARTAGDVATALKLAEAYEFDLLLSDLGLPDGSGVDLMRELRRRGHTVPGIALSGYGQEEDIQRSREAGFVAHLTKPVNIEHLREVIAEVAGVAASH